MSDGGYYEEQMDAEVSRLRSEVVKMAMRIAVLEGALRELGGLDEPSVTPPLDCGCKVRAADVCGDLGLYPKPVSASDT